MRYLIVFLFLMPIQILFGQDAQKSFIKSGITKSKGKSLYFENDKNGNVIFSINQEMNGPITMIFAIEYDSLKRETKYYWVHSNLGFFISEKVYENGCVKNYELKAKSDTAYAFDIEALKEIDSRAEFTDLMVFSEMESGNRILSNIDFLDSADNVIKEIYLSENGDTTSINYSTYNSNNQETFYHHGDNNDEFWVWDIFNLYDEDNNLVKSFRISSSDGIKDTTEYYNYIYDKDNRLISHNFSFKNGFTNRTDYYYNSNNQVILELFYEDSETELKAKTIFRYDGKGNVKKKVLFDYRNPKREQKEVFNTKLEYW
jgi:hypothetical protein